MKRNASLMAGYDAGHRAGDPKCNGRKGTPALWLAIKQDK